MSTVQSTRSPRRPAAPYALVLFAILTTLPVPRAATAGPAGPLFRASYLAIDESVSEEGPHPFAVGDVNNDHALDLVVVRGRFYGPYGSVGLYLGDGYGNFATPVNLDGALSQDVWGIDLADLNRDGRLDLIFSSRRDTFVYVRLGHGDGTFDSPIASANRYTVNSVSVGDMNEDGIPDLVVGQGPFGSGFSILCGDGTGHFALSYRGPSDDTAQSILTDMDGDGHLDIVGADNVYHAGDGHGATTGERWAGEGGWGSAIAVADLDGDGNKDLLTAGLDDQRLYVRYSMPGGQFAETGSRDTAYQLDDPIRSIAARDLDGDGRPEIITGGARVRVFATDSAGRLHLREELPSPSVFGPCALEVADLNDDGRPDIIAAAKDAIGVYLTGPGGTFPMAPSYALAGRPGPAVSGDFSGDGHADVAVLLPGEDSVEVVRGAPDGAMTLESQAQVGHGPTVMLRADVDGDGQDDLVIADSLDAAITTLTHWPDHSWLRADTPGVTGMHWLAIDDADQDGWPDLVTEDCIAGDVYVMRGSAAGFGAPAVVAGSVWNAEAGTLADLDLDGDPDLMVVERDGSVQVLAGGPGTSFVWKATHSGDRVPAGVTGAAPFAFDPDTLPDLMLSGSAGFCILRNSGPWSFTGGWRSTGNLSSYNNGTEHIALADLDGDGRTDFAATLQWRPYVSTFRRNPSADFDENVWGYGFGASFPDQGLLADVTGDGLPDLVVTDPDAWLLWVAPHAPGASVAVAPGASQRVGAVAFAGSTPNPTRGAATLRFEHVAGGAVTLEIADVRGRMVRRLAKCDVTAGALSVAWDGRDDAGARVGPGVYFARIVTAQGGTSGKLVVF